jgi:hypothetical protein
MADSTYKILEYRIVDNTTADGLDDVWAYICITDPTDFLPIGGWYGKQVPVDAPAHDFLSRALASGDFLTQWEHVAPDDVNRDMQARYDALMRHVEDMTQREAERMMGIKQQPPGATQ